jgi:glucose-6-phosphate isomerase
MAWIDLPFNQTKIVDEILRFVSKRSEKISDFVLFGIGGSALGPLALHQAINGEFYNQYSNKSFPNFFVADNIDPERLTNLLKVIDIKHSLFNIVSKSGNTSETMSQFLIIKDLLQKKLGIDESRKHIICTTDKDKGNLLNIARKNRYDIFYIPDGVGGRFSELTPVGLLPAAFTGINIRELLAGAKFMHKLCVENKKENIACMYAMLNYIAYTKHNKNICVMMPYADSLKFISDWYAQIWAESLGKKFDRNGAQVNFGQTPVKSLGVTDQHSQIQLYNEGPYDKIIIFICVEKYRAEITVPQIDDCDELKNLSFLSNITHNKLIATEQLATELALTRTNRMNMKIILPQINEFTLGQLFYFFEIATAYAGEFFNIDAFNQPGVEEAKNITYSILGK